MAHVHERSPSLEPSSDSLLKRLKTTHSSSTSSADHELRFYPGLFGPENVQRLHQAYADSEPFKYAIIEKLFQDDLLKNVKDECMNELSFTEKETDIYKVSHSILDYHPSLDISFLGQSNRGPCITLVPL